MTESNPTNLVNHLQSERILRWPEVKHRVGYSRSHTHNLIAEGKFHAPIKLGGRASGWVESEISEWIESRIDISRREGSLLTTSATTLNSAGIISKSDSNNALQELSRQALRRRLKIV